MDVPSTGGIQKKTGLRLELLNGFLMGIGLNQVSGCPRYGLISPKSGSSKARVRKPERFHGYYTHGDQRGDP
jgi:hypothetical protein